MVSAKHNEIEAGLYVLSNVGYRICVLLLPHTCNDFSLARIFCFSSHILTLTSPVYFQLHIRTLILPVYFHFHLMTLILSVYFHIHIVAITPVYFHFHIRTLNSPVYSQFHIVVTITPVIVTTND